MQKPYTVGITGGSASGKTLFLKGLMNEFSEGEVCLLSQDNYYRPTKEQPTDAQNIANYDTPQSIDNEEFMKDIALLRSGKTVTLPEYTYNNPDVEPKLLTFQPAPIIVVEGIFVFYFEEIAKQLDLKVFVDAKEHIKLARRIRRDQEERGYGLDDVLYRYEKHVVPAYERYIEPFKYDADLIVPNNLHFKKALNVLSVFLKSKLLT